MLDGPDASGVPGGTLGELLTMVKYQNPERERRALVVGRGFIVQRGGHIRATIETQGPAPALGVLTDGDVEGLERAASFSSASGGRI